MDKETQSVSIMGKDLQSVSITELKQGDIVVSFDSDNKEYKSVLYKVIYREDSASTVYDRTYLFIDIDTLERLIEEENTNLLSDLLLISACTKVDLKGMSGKNVVVHKNEAPYEFQSSTYVNIRRKVPKTITIYE